MVDIQRGAKVVLLPSAAWVHKNGPLRAGVDKLFGLLIAAGYDAWLAPDTCADVLGCEWWIGGCHFDLFFVALLRSAYPDREDGGRFFGSCIKLHVGTALRFDPHLMTAATESSRRGSSLPCE